MIKAPVPPKRDIKRVVPDPTALRALSHPERLRMLGLLRVEGPATATGLANKLGLNSGATSYHLRQLAEHGFIEHAKDLGTRRERWWRARHESTTFETAGQSGDALEAGLAMSQAILAQHSQQMQRAHEEYRDLPQAWREASTASDFIIPLTPQAARELTEKIMGLLWEAKANSPEPGTPLPQAARPFTVMLHAFPYPGIDAPEDEA